MFIYLSYGKKVFHQKVTRAVNSCFLGSNEMSLSTELSCEDSDFQAAREPN